MGSRIKDIGSKDLKGTLDLAWCRGALGLSISVIIMVILESGEQIRLQNVWKIDKKLSKSQLWGGLGGSWKLLGCSWVLRVGPWKYFGGFKVISGVVLGALFHEKID